MIKVSYKPEYLAYVVVRYREGMPGEYFTQKGWKERKTGQAFEIDESMLWDTEDLQDLVTQLAKDGVKPKDSAYIEGKLEATNRHLEDMRTLVLKRK